MMSTCHIPKLFAIQLLSKFAPLTTTTIMQEACKTITSKSVSHAKSFVLWAQTISQQNWTPMRDASAKPNLYSTYE